MVINLYKDETIACDQAVRRRPDFACVSFWPGAPPQAHGASPLLVYRDICRAFLQIPFKFVFYNISLFSARAAWADSAAWF